MRNLLKNNQGVVTIEFALVALTMIAMLPLMFDLSNVVSASMSLSGSLRAGVQYALTEPSDTAGITNTIQTASGFSSSTVSVTQTCHCSGTLTTCGSTCSGNAAQDMYLTITANYSVPTMLPYANYPSNSFPISASTYVRVQ